MCTCWYYTKTNKNNDKRPKARDKTSAKRKQTDNLININNNYFFGISTERAQIFFFLLYLDSNFKKVNYFLFYKQFFFILRKMSLECCRCCVNILYRNWLTCCCYHSNAFLFIHFQASLLNHFRSSIICRIICHIFQVYLQFLFYNWYWYS